MIKSNDSKNDDDVAVGPNSGYTNDNLYDDPIIATVRIPKGRALITVDEEKWLQFKKSMECKHTDDCNEIILMFEIDNLFSSALVYKPNTSTTSAISFEGKPARRDELKKLGKIARALLNLSNYPEIGPVTLSNLIETVLGSNDGRTKEKYLHWVEQYSDIIREDNTEFYNVARFVRLVLGKDIL